jgi:hypothetical protein
MLVHKGVAAAAAVAWLALPAAAQPVSQIVGLDDLIARLGGSAPNGAGVVVAQVEAPVGGSYGPDQTHPEFAGKTFVARSGAPGNSGHATTVGRNMYGLTTSIAPGIDEINLYEAGHWLGAGLLRTGFGGGSPPQTTPGGIKLFNNSWIGSAGSSTVDNEALRRADFLISRDNLVIVNGVNNGGASMPLLSHLFNGIAVGLRDGNHTFTNTQAAYDGPGRLKPEIVAPSNLTSFATPIVNAATAILVETARTTLPGSPNAERSEVLKAAILAGATHENLATGTWSHNAATSGPNRGVTGQPIDDVVGVGTVQINRSHLVLTRGEQDGSSSVPASPNAIWAGWDLAFVPANQSRYWRFNVRDRADAVSIIATWHRDVDQPFGNVNWRSADFDLTLWRHDQGLVTLVGNAGLAHFGGGNVVSASDVDNVEHLYISDLEPGQYVLELDLVDAAGLSVWRVGVAWLFPAPVRPEDINGDGVVDVLDLLLVLTAWGSCPGCPEDVNGDGVVDVLDLLAVLTAWG